MCTVDHVAFARPGYLIDTRMESVAAGGCLFTRMLHHWDEVGLSTEQVLALLKISGEYHDRQIQLRIEFAKVSERLEIKWGRVDEAGVAARQPLLDRHAELFRREEALFFEYGAKGHAILTDEQIEAAEAVYHAEKNDGLKELVGVLDSAVAPAFTFRPLVQHAGAPNSATPRTPEVPFHPAQQWTAARVRFAVHCGPRPTLV